MRSVFSIGAFICLIAAYFGGYPGGVVLGVIGGIFVLGAFSPDCRTPSEGIDDV